MIKKSWICKECSEKIGQEFDTCWSCGYSINDKVNSNNDIDENEKFLKSNNEIDKLIYVSQNKNKIKKEMYSDIENFIGLKKYKIILWISMFINVILGLYLIALSPYLILPGFIYIILSCYVVYNTINMIDFLFFLNSRIDKIEKNKK